MNALTTGTSGPSYHDLFNLASALSLATQEKFLRVELASGIFKKALKDAKLLTDKPEIKKKKEV